MVYTDTGGQKPEAHKARRTWIPAAATLVVLVAFARMPYGYYVLLRLGLCCACVYYLVERRLTLATAHLVGLGGMAVLYNPLVPVHLGSKPLWTAINIGTVAYFWLLEGRGGR